MRFIGALLITYFLTRGLGWLGLRHPPVIKLFAAHVLSLVAITLLVVALRYPSNAYESSQLTVYFVAQAIWLVFDLYRARIAIWRAPVAETTGSSAKGRGAGTP